MIRFRFLLRELIARDLKVRYAGSVLGFLWAFVNPLWQLGLFSIVFSAILRMQLVGEGTQSFPAFLFAGLLPWTAISDALNRGTSSVVENAPLVKKHAFPSELLVTAVVFSALIHSAIALGFFFLIRLATASVAWLHLPGLALGMGCQVLMTLGFAWLLATAYVYVRDIQHSLTLVLSALFYLTPMVYPLALVPDRFRAMVELNPLSTIVGFYRAFLIGSQSPHLTPIVVLVATSLLVSGFGLSLFRRAARNFSDEL